MEWLDNFIQYISTWLRLLKNNVRIFKLEAKLAQLSFIRLITAALVFFGVAVVAWLSILFIFGYEIFHHTHDMLITGMTIFSINLLLLLGLIIYMLRQIKNMQFRHSKAAMRILTRMQNNNENKEMQATNSSAAQ